MAAGCLLSFSGVPISDDEELYASAARNLAVNGTLSAEQLYGNARLSGNYHGVEPAFPAIASLWYRLFLPVPLGHLQSLYLLPVLSTALSAALIVVIAGQLGFSTAVGAAAALLYAFSSMAWPYAKTLFREPLIALLLLGSLSGFLWIVDEGRRFLPSVTMLVLLILLLAALVLTRVVMAAAAIILLLALPLAHPASRRNKRQLSLTVLACAVLVLILGVGLSRIHATDADVLYRFTGGFVQDAIARSSSISHSHLAEALAAPLISPWKGLLFYSPICLVGLISLAVYCRRQREVLVLALTVLASLLLMQALAYDGEWWTPTWGSRFLLPAIPLLTVGALPLLERLTRQGRSGWLVILGIFIAGFVIQLPAVLLNSAEFTAMSYQEANGAFPAGWIWDVARTPIIAQWRALASQRPDLLLWRTAGTHLAIVLIVCVLALGALLSALFLLRQAILGLGGTLVLVALPAALITFAAIALLNLSVHDPEYEMPAFEPLCGYFRGHVQPGDVLVVQPYPGPAWQYLMNSECGQRVWYSLPYEHARETAAALIARQVPAHAHYWVIQQFWSDTFSVRASTLAAPGDRLLQEVTFHSPYHLFVGEYERGHGW